MEKFLISKYEGGNLMNAKVYENLENCKDFSKIDEILDGYGYVTVKEKYNYLLKRMRIVTAQFTGIEDDDFDTMYNLAKENYLLGYWREQNAS